ADTSDVHKDRLHARRQLSNVHLQANPANGNATSLEIFRHFVNRVGLDVQFLTAVVIVEKQGIRIGLMRPAKHQLDISSSFFGQTNSRLVVPWRAAEFTSVV